MRDLNDELSDFARTIVRGEEPSSQINANYSKYSATVAIEVYRNNYRGNLHDTLVGAYPVIEQLVGKDFFRMMTRNYIGQHLSRGGNLHHYGAEMANFIADFEPAQGLAYLPDVARLEWACHCAYFAEDADTLDISNLAQISPERYADLILHSSCLWVRSRYPIADIWHAHQPGANSDFHIDLDSAPCIALVNRRKDIILVSELSIADAEWLQAMQAGNPLGTTTDTVLKNHPDFDLQATLLNLVAQNIFTHFSLNTASVDTTP